MLSDPCVDATNIGCQHESMSRTGEELDQFLCGRLIWFQTAGSKDQALSGILPGCANERTALQRLIWIFVLFDVGKFEDVAY
jgi:hypothetical protein